LAPARKIAKKPKRGPRRVVRRKTAAREETPPPSPATPRPHRYTQALGEAICERLANGESATEVCRDPSMPTWAMLKRWERDNTDFARRYHIARVQCCEYHTDEILTIADDASNDYVERLTAKGRRVVFDRESFERSRLRVDARKWTASKILRHVYGDKSEVDVRTPEGLKMEVVERNALIDAICKLVSPKVDGTTKPSGRTEEARER
jgi:hypothetical protein